MGLFDRDLEDARVFTLDAGKLLPTVLLNELSFGEHARNIMNFARTEAGQGRVHDPKDLFSIYNREREAIGCSPAPDGIEKALLSRDIQVIVKY